VPGPADDQRSGLVVSVTDERGQRAAPGLGVWLTGVAGGHRRARGRVNVAIVADARVRALNKRYRGKDYATDVLSFPTWPDASTLTPSSSSAAPSRFLGDIVIARGVARRQARQAGHGERRELRMLALHGLLHLLGYDHERDTGQMARLERSLQRKGGL
jgi:probable rRNA maturation factor